MSVSTVFPLRRANAEAVKCLYRYRAILARLRFEQNSESRFSLWVLVWHAHLDARCERSNWSRAKTKLSTADCFSTRQSRLCHEPGSNTSENTKTRLSKASCYLPYAFSSSNWRRGSMFSTTLPAHVLIVLLSLQFILFTLPIAKLLQLCLVLCKFSVSNYVCSQNHW